MSSSQPDLPYVDEHTVTVPGGRDLVWAGLERHVARSLGIGDGNPLGRILGTEPRSGFAVAGSEPNERLTLAGRHRFSHYRLVFELDDGPAGATVLRAQTYAVFPGVRGRIYRALVIGSRAHVVATRGILRSIRRECLR